MAIIVKRFNTMTIEIQTNLKTFERWLQDNYSNKATRKLYLDALQHRYPSIVGSTILSEDTIRLFIDQTMRSDKRKPNPFYMAFIKALIECFDPNDTIPFRIKRDRSSKPKPIRKPTRLTEEEIKTIIASIDNKQISLMVQIYYDTGLRLMELIKVKREDIDTKTHHMRGIGKKNKEFNVHYSRDTAIKIWKWLKEDRKDPKKKGYKYPFLLIRRDGQRYVNQASAFRHKLKDYAKKIIGKKIHPHLIRHALGYTLRAEKDWDLEQVRAKLRHTNIATTQIYTEATEQEIEQKEDEEIFK